MGVTEYDSVSWVEVSHVNFKWTIMNFSNCFEMPHISIYDTFYSSSFDLGGTEPKWQLVMRKDGPYVNFYLEPLGTIDRGKKIEWQVSFFGSDGIEAHQLKCVEECVTQNTTSMIWGASISSEDIESKNLVVNDKLTLLFEIKVTEFVNSTSVRKKKDPVPTVVKNEGLEQLFGSLLHSDVTFVADGKELPAHKALVAAKSPVFDAMFKNQMKEQQTNRIEVEEGAQVFEELLRFIYTGQTEKVQTLAQDLLIAADKYQVDKLKSDCEQELMKQLDKTNATRLLVLADMHNATELKNETIDYINANSSSIGKTEGWKALVEGYPKLVIECYSKLMNV